MPEPEGLASAPDLKSREGAWPGRAHHALPAHQHPDTHGEYPLPVPGSWLWAPGGGTLPAAPWRLPPRRRLRVPGRGSRLGHTPAGGGGGWNSDPAWIQGLGSSGGRAPPAPGRGTTCVRPRHPGVPGACGSGPTCLREVETSERLRKSCSLKRSNHCPTQSRSAGQ